MFQCSQHKDCEQQVFMLAQDHVIVKTGHDLDLARVLRFNMD